MSQDNSTAESSDTSQTQTDPNRNPSPRSPSSRRGGRGDNSWKAYSHQWKENHGWVLMSFAGVVFLIGCAVLSYQQTRFRPPAFPNATAIQSPYPPEDDLIELPDDPQLMRESAPLNDPTADGLTDVASQANLVSGFRLKINGAATDGGPVRVAIYESKGDFNEVEKASWKGSLPVRPDGIAETTVPLEGRPDRFAIAAYHDKNDNNQLDRNALRIPTERYGFSNSARGKLGPPSFEEALIDRPEAGTTIELEIW